MKLLFHTPLDEIIVKVLLEHKELSVEGLHRLLSTKEVVVSIQAIYKRIRILIQDGIIIKSKKRVAVSSEWSQGILQLLNDDSSLPVLNIGESAVYTFRSLSSLDAYWKHLAITLEKNLSDEPVFFYNPHEIWVHLEDRQESENKYLSNFEKNKRYGFLLIGGATSLDRDFKQKYHNAYLQVANRKINSFPENDYLTIISDYIITTKLTTSLTKYIEDIFQNLTNADKLKKAFTGKQNIKLKIEKNLPKAKMLRKKLVKDFYLPKEIKNKNNLF